MVFNKNKQLIRGGLIPKICKYSKVIPHLSEEEDPFIPSLQSFRGDPFEVRRWGIPALSPL